MLRIALKHGLILKKIHAVLRFSQSPWLRKYIELNTKERTKTRNSFEKELYKLMNNAIFGKCMENVRKRIKLFLRSTWEGRYGARNLVASPFFKNRTIFNEHLVAIEMNKQTIVMDKPIPTGLAVLDLSKVVMYEFYYEYLKPKYGENIQLMYTDTDSFIILVKTQDFYEDIQADIHRFDSSDYPQNNKFNMPLVNMKKPGAFSDEMGGKLITRFVGLRSKMYSLCVPECAKEEDREVKRAKGVKKSLLRTQISFENYMHCLLSNEILTKDQITFRTKLHHLFTVKQVNKIALSALDDKRYLMKCNSNESERNNCDYND